MNNKVNVQDQISRMKGLMTYGLQTESKNAPFASVEFKKQGADGKMYGIVREGTKYYIKTCASGKGLVKEDYDYIGGFRNRKNNEYTSYANALKQFDLKMASLKEANTPDKKIVIESWNPDKKEMLTIESTDKMRKEIARERQIMRNASMITEGKNECCSAPFCETVQNVQDGTIDLKGCQKDNISSKVKDEAPKDKKSKGGEVKEGKETLAWHKQSGRPQDDHYMDMSHGTQIGDSAPFDDAEARNIDDQDKQVSKTGEMKNGVVESYHGKVMHTSQNQNSPEVGTAGRKGAKGVDAPFEDDDKYIKEDVDSEEGLIEADEPVDGEDPEEAPEGEEMGDDFDAEETPEFDEEGDEDSDFDAEDFDDDELEDEPVEDFGDEDLEDGDVEDRLSALEDLVQAIADKLGVDEFEDDELYDDDEPVEDDEPSEDFGEDDVEPAEFGDEDMEEEGSEFGPAEYPEEEVHESRSYRKMRIAEARRNKRLAEDRLDYFGKHPAYQKTVMSLPPKDMQEFPDYYDMNDDSVRNDRPYGQQIGDGAPFEVDPQEIENAIVESIQRYLGEGSKKKDEEWAKRFDFMFGKDVNPFNEKELNKMGLTSDEVTGRKSAKKGKK